MNVKLRSKAYVDSGEVRNILYRHLSMNVADVLMDWLLAGMEARNTNIPPDLKKRFGGGR